MLWVELGPLDRYGETLALVPVGVAYFGDWGGGGALPRLVEVREGQTGLRSALIQ